MEETPAAASRGTIKQLDGIYISYFPGQTIYHGGLLRRHESGKRIFFAGDSFTPSGMDDYCLLNRNFLAPEKGFLDCLRQIRNL
jgi:hypothetical protein